MGQEYAMNQVGLIDKDQTEKLFKLKGNNQNCFSNESNITVVDSNQTANKDTKFTSSQAYFDKTNYSKPKHFDKKDGQSCEIKEWQKRQSNTAQQDKRKTSAAK